MGAWKGIVRRLLEGMSPEHLEDLVDEAIRFVLEARPPEEGQALALRLVRRSLRRLEASLTREERARMMNALLPDLIAVFPLEELNLLDALSGSKEEATDGDRPSP